MIILTPWVQDNHFLLWNILMNSTIKVISAITKAENIVINDKDSKLSFGSLSLILFNYSF